MRLTALALVVLLAACGAPKEEEAAAPAIGSEVPRQPQANQAPTASPSPITIDMASAELPRGLEELSGMASAEAWGRWSIGDTVRIRFAEPLPLAFKLEFTARAFGPNVGKVITVRVGSDEQQFTATGDEQVHTLAFTLAETANTIEFAGLTPTSPESLGVSEDPRPLGLGIGTLTVSTLGTLR